MQLTRSLIASLLATATLPAAADAFDYVDFEIRSPAPKIFVTGDAQGWQSAAPVPLIYLSRARGRCAWGFRATFASLTLDKNGGGLLAGEKLLDAPKTKNRTWTSKWKDLSISWPANNKVSEVAVTACNTALSERVKAGQSAAAVLEAGLNVEINPASPTLHFSCDDYLATGYKKDLRRNAPVTVACQPVKIPNPSPELPSPAIKAARPAFKLNHVELVADPQNYKGPCPKDITFTGNIHSNAEEGDASYRFMRDGKPLTPFTPLSFASGQSKAEVSYVMSADMASFSPHGKLTIHGNTPTIPQAPKVKAAPQVSIEVKAGEQNIQTKAQYAFTCQENPARASIATIKPDLSSQQGIQIGNNSSPWGGIIELDATNANQISPNGCGFRYAYDVINIGDSSTGSFSNRLFDGATVLHHHAGMSLPAGGVGKANGSITLQPGAYMLKASIDDGQVISEHNENNNTFRVMVNVADNCLPALPQTSTATPGESPLRPSSPAPTGRPIPGKPPR